MVFNPAQFGATPVKTGTTKPFNPAHFGATPFNASTDLNTAKQNYGAGGALRQTNFAKNGNTWTPIPYQSANSDGQMNKTGSAVVDSKTDALPDTTDTSGTTIGKIGANVEDVGVGLVKGAVSVPVDTASGLQSLGQGIQSLLTKIPVLGKYLKVSAGIPSLNTSTPEGKAVQDELAAKSKAEQGGEILGNIGAGLIGGGEAAADETVQKGAGLLKDATSAVGEEIDSMLAQRATAKATKAGLDYVAPKMTAKETTEALAQGRGEGGGVFSKTKIAPTTRTQQVYDAVKTIINPSKSGAENINNIRTALSTEAENLKTQIQAVDHPYIFKELGAKLNAIETPISIRGTAFEKQIGLVKDAAMNIAKEAGGKVSNLLDARKSFDALVEKEYPKLYDTDYAPMKSAITGIRNAMNDFIESNLPDNMSFKDSLKKQSLFYDAIDNIAEKSVGETKTTGLQRGFKIVKEHPVGSLLTGAGTGEAVRKVVTGKF